MCIWRDERENRERKDEERGGSEVRGSSAPGPAPYRGADSLGDPRYVGRRALTGAKRLSCVWGPRFTAQLESRRKRTGAGMRCG